MKKKNKRIIIIVITILMIGIIGAGVNSKNILKVSAYTSEPECKNGVYQIRTIEELAWFAEYVNTKSNRISGELKNNITMHSYDSVEMNTFDGTFDGNGFNLVMDNTEAVLFHCVYGTLKNIKVTGSMCVKGNASSLCTSNMGNIINCGSDVNFYDFDIDDAAGICLFNQGTISRSYNRGNISGTGTVAGIVVDNDGTVENCYNSGYINNLRYNEENVVAGIAADNRAGNIIDSISYGALSSMSDEKYGIGKDGTIDNCYSTEDSTGFSTGEITYLLNHKSTKDVVWGQKIGFEKYPGFNTDNIVYYGYDGWKLKYSNKKLSDTPVQN